MIALQQMSVLPARLQECFELERIQEEVNLQKMP